MRSVVRKMVPCTTACKLVVIMDAKPQVEGVTDDFYRWFEYLLAAWNVPHAERHAVFLDPPTVLERQWLPSASERRVTEARLEALLGEATVVYVVGGNPYELMRHLEARPKLRTTLTRRVRRGECLYIARSAGSMVVGDTTWHRASRRWRGRGGGWACCRGW